MTKDYFAILGFNLPLDGVQLGEDWRDHLEKRYYKLVKKVHPDRFVHNSPLQANQSDLKSLGNDLFKEVLEAYEVLSDPKKTEQYLTQVVAMAKNNRVFEDSKMEEMYHFNIVSLLD